MTELTDKELIENESHWPMGGYLPLLRTDRSMFEPDRYGFLLAQGKPNRVFIGNVETIKRVKKLMEKVPYVDYETVDALLADNWIVD